MQDITEIGVKNHKHTEVVNENQSVIISEKNYYASEWECVAVA